jgi:FKBP-type peptidyl-prolyl cis-trans isomerase/thiol-disulfide isomerase/thioredoxin
MKTKYIVAAILFLWCKALWAQNTNVVNKIVEGIPNLNIGEQLPDFAIKRLINLSKSEIRSSDYKDRLLIVDFWTTWCPGCVAAMPKLDQLQKKFGNKIKILPVSPQPANVVKQFWLNNKYTKSLTLPSVVEDQLFSSYFRHRTIPHEVWIYKGKVIAITAADYVDAPNIEKVLSGQLIDWPVKNDFYSFDANKIPLFEADPNQLDTVSTFFKYAAISGYKEGVNAEGLSGGSGIVRDAKKKTVRAYFLNQSIYSSYLLNWNGTGIMDSMTRSTYQVSPNQIVWEVGDQSRFKYDPKLGYEQSWIKRNGICYESLNPDTGQIDEQIHLTIIKDLNRLLGLNVRWEKRNEQVIVLIKESNHEARAPLSGKSISIADLVYALNQHPNYPYVIDETGYDGNGVLPIASNESLDTIGLRKVLKNCGLDFKYELRPVNKLIFSELNGGLLVDGEMAIAAKSKRFAQRNLRLPTIDEQKNFLNLNKKKAGVISLPSGLQYQILKKGNGRIPSANDKVSVQYEGTLVNGKIFDSSYDSGRPSEFVVSNLIKGWSEALSLMPEGSRWRLYIPAELAYGSGTASGTVPPNSDLIFEIELLKLLNNR